MCEACHPVFVRSWDGFSSELIFTNENQDTTDEFTAKIQELQNEVNCMNDSKDFKDAELVHIGQSHVTSQPAFFPPHPIPGGQEMGSPRHARNRRWRIGEGPEPACVRAPFQSFGVEH